jgi:hypothetical protein
MRFPILILALTLGSSFAVAGKVKKGVTQAAKLSGGSGKLGQKEAGEFQVQHSDEFKGAKRIGISVFNVAFPDDNFTTAHMHKKLMGNSGSWDAKVSMQTTLEGVDTATRQRIADAAYADFTGELKKAGYEVVEGQELAKVTPEYAGWTALPNFTKGRFGTYVAPTGHGLYFLPLDKASRDTGSFKGETAQMFRGFDRPQAYGRSPYLAHDANLGIVAVTLVIDYGVYSTTGKSSRVREGAAVGFEAGVSAQSGTLGDTGTLVYFWGPKSGGFPGVLALAVPVVSEQEFAEVSKGSSVVVKADPARFEKAALEVSKRTAAKLVEAMTAAR